MKGGHKRRERLNFGYADAYPVPETNSMADKPGQPDNPEPLELIPDFLGEDRHEFVAKLAYQLWEERGRPFGSPEVDWFRAERAVYSSLLAPGLITQSANGSRNMAEKIYR